MYVIYLFLLFYLKFLIIYFVNSTNVILLFFLFPLFYIFFWKNSKFILQRLHLWFILWSFKWFVYLFFKKKNYFKNIYFYFQIFNLIKNVLVIIVTNIFNFSYTMSTFKKEIIVVILKIIIKFSFFLLFYRYVLKFCIFFLYVDKILSLEDFIFLLLPTRIFLSSSSPSSSSLPQHLMAVGVTEFYDGF